MMDPIDLNEQNEQLEAAYAAMQKTPFQGTRTDTAFMFFGVLLYFASLGLLLALCGLAVDGLVKFLTG